MGLFNLQRFSRKERLEKHARYRTYNAFMSDYRSRYAHYVYEDPAYDNGCTLIDAAFTNPKDGLKIVDVLLRDGADPSLGAPLVILLSSKRYSLEQKAVYMRRLLDKGADINALYNRCVSPLEAFALSGTIYNEDKLAPIYDIFFAQKNLDIHVRTSFKAIDFYEVAQKWRERMPDLLRRMDEHEANRIVQ